MRDRFSTQLENLLRGSLAGEDARMKAAYKGEIEQRKDLRDGLEMWRKRYDEAEKERELRFNEFLASVP